jgi:hypothetical protein
MAARNGKSSFSIDCLRPKFARMHARIYGEHWAIVKVRAVLRLSRHEG